MAKRVAVEWTKDRGGRGALRATVGDVRITVTPWRRREGDVWSKRVVCGWGWSLYGFAPGVLGHIEARGAADGEDVTPASAQADALAHVGAIQRGLNAMRSATPKAAS